jgi:predicted transposase/invertase (TIGR01784 family)
VKDDWIDNGLNEYRADILYRATLLRQRGYVYFLFEHKSYPYKKTGYQLLRYMVRIWDEIEKQKKVPPKKPVIIPFIIYHGRKYKSHNTSNSIKPLFAIFKGTEKYIPDFETVMIDLTSIDDTDLGTNAEQKTFLLALKYSRDTKILQKVPEIIRPFNSLGEKENEYLKVVLFYIGSAVPKEQMNELLECIKREHKNGDTFMETVADALREEGRAEGKTEGKVEGKIEGKIEVAENMLLKGMSIEIIHEVTGLSIKLIKELMKKLKKT